MKSAREYNPPPTRAVKRMSNRITWKGAAHVGACIRLGKKMRTWKASLMVTTIDWSVASPPQSQGWDLIQAIY